MTGGLSSRMFISVSRASGTPTPLSLTSISTPPLGISWPDMCTGVSLEEKIVAFSMISASRCTTSDTAGPGDRDARLDLHRHPAVLLDLRRRGPDHVRERHRFAPLARGLVPGQQEQVLRVPAHSGDQVVHREQVGQPVGIGLVLLEGVDHARQPLDQRLAAPGQVDEHRVEAAAQHRLVAGQPYRLRVHLVERAGDLADLVGGHHVDRRHLQARGRIRVLAQPPDPLRKLHRGDVERALPQPAQRPDQGPGHDERRDQHEEQDDRGHDGVEQRGLLPRPAAAPGCARRCSWLPPARRPASCRSCRTSPSTSAQAPCSG